MDTKGFDSGYWKKHRRSLAKDASKDTPMFTFVRFCNPDAAKYGYPLYDGEVCLWLGEIPQMPAHCVVVGYYSGKVYSGYHTDNFKLIPEKEL